MYNPCRGGVRGGADQFTWENVKTDKYRENYLGHSLKAPVGRWQKGKDLSWYAKERKDDENFIKAQQSELAAVKKAEEEALLIALGHNIIKKEIQMPAKEDLNEALRRNIGERDNLNVDRIDGLGSTSHRSMLAAGITNNLRNKEGVIFENPQLPPVVKDSNLIKQDEVNANKYKKSEKKSSKKHKAEKKHKKHKRKRSDSSSVSSSDSDTSVKYKPSKKSHKKLKSKEHSKKHKHKSKSKHKDYSYNSSDSEDKRHKEKHKKSIKKRHDTSESD